MGIGRLNRQRTLKKMLIKNGVALIQNNIHTLNYLLLLPIFCLYSALKKNVHMCIRLTSPALNVRTAAPVFSNKRMAWYIPVDCSNITPAFIKIIVFSLNL